MIEWIMVAVMLMVNPPGKPQHAAFFVDGFSDKQSCMEFGETYKNVMEAADNVVTFSCTEKKI